MRNNKKERVLHLKNAAAVITCFMAALLLTGCSQKITFPGSKVIPAAEAKLNVDKNSNDNYKLELRIKNIADPERLSPSRKYYIVWMETRKNGTIKMGNLNVNRKNQAELDYSTPYKPERVFITAENNQNTSSPSRKVVLNSGKI
ncbi:hypothetical protein [Zunongwangia sp. H14]|uniref:hypothetical protein n=1 Tax=Zunongwangia sp. H14 TaxID=3240792 RepID=UPI00356A38D9